VPSSGSPRRNRPDLHFYTRSLGYGEVEKRDGVPVTTVARALADLATSLERVPAVWALDDALRRGLCAKPDIIAVIERWRGATGCVSARDRLEEVDGRLSQSWRRRGGWCCGPRSTAAIPQHELWAPDGTLVARLDGAYLREKVALEFDGAGFAWAARSCFPRSLAAKRLTGVGLDCAALHLVGRDARPRWGSRHCAADTEPARILRPAPSSGVGGS
jgi:hypothetical protein